MAIKTTGSLIVKSGVNTTVDAPQNYDDVFTTKFTYTEATSAGANAFKIHSDTNAVTLSLKGTSGDVLVIDGYSGDYTAKLSGSKLTLDNNNQTITVALAAKSTVTLKFLDGSKDVNLVDKTLGGESLATKTGVLHINGMNSHELTSVTNAVKAALTDTNKKYYATVDAAIISDNAVVKSTALTDKSGKSYATVDLAITSNDAAITTQALTDTTVTPNVVYPNLNAAILSNDQAIISKALVGTNFSSIADLVAAYNKFALQSLATFKVESLDAKMVPASAVSVSEGATAYFKVSLTNRVSGDYSVKTILTGTLATPDSDFVNSLTLDSASLAAGIKFNPATGILTIPASSQSISAILSTTIKNDTVSPEAGEKVNLAISDAQGTSVAPLGTTDIASVTILDVIPPTFSVTANTGPVLEGTSTTFTVNLANHTVGDYSVKVALTGNNANLNSDFSALTLDPTTPAAIKFDSVKGILTIPADTKTTSVKFNTNINTDNRAETGQSVTLALSQDTTNLSNANTVIASTASSTTAVITEVLPPTFAITADSINEGTTASFNITLINNPDPKSDYSIKATLGAAGASVLGTDFSGTLTLDSASIAAGIKFDSITGLLTIPATTIVAANTAKQTVKATLTTTTNPDNVASVKGMSLALSTPTGTNVAAAPAPATIDIINVPATLLTTDIDPITTPDNSNTLIMANTLTINANATAFDSVKDNAQNDNDVMTITTNSWPVSPAKTILIDKIETINLTALDTITVDNSTISGVNNFNIKNSTAAVTLDKINSASTILGLEGALVNNLTAKYKTAPKITDTLTVVLNNATNAIFTLDSTIILDKGFGFAELSVLNTSTLTSFDGRVSTLTISGTGALTIGDTTLADSANSISATGLIGVTDIELSNTGAIKLGKIGKIVAGSSNTAHGYLTTFKAPNNTGGITTDVIQGATGGFTMQLGSWKDSISVQDNAATATNINDIRLGAGNDIINFSTPTTGKTYISGDDGNDTINISLTTAGSSTSINTIDGGSGDDRITIAIDPTITPTITTISSSFIISGGMGSDFISGSISSDTIDGGDDNDTITGGTGNDTITGGTGNDTIYVDSGIDTITDFKVGEDTLIISSGATAKVSFAGNSAVSYATVSNAGILDVTLATISTVIGSTGIDSITGSIGADSIDGGLGDDTINAGDGNDTIIGGDGSDSIDGGSGDDAITAGNGVDTINGGDGNDTISMTLAQLFNTNTDGNNVVYVTNSIDSINGDNGTDSILITDTENPVNINVTNASTLSRITNIEQLKAGPNRFPISISVNANNKFNTIDLSNDTNAGGTNTITSTGSSSNISTIIGSAGIDQITLGASAPSATITGGSGADVFNISNNSVVSNTITDLSGTDSLAVSSGSTVNATVTANYTAASAANTGTINISTAGFVVNMAAETGSSGSISITNTGSATTLVGGAGSNTINGGAGNDTINGGAGSATISGGAGNDMITAGAAGTNSITGGYGDDTIVGSAGVDTINVDYGTDTITNLGTGDVLTVNYYATANATLSGTSPSWTPTSSTTNNGVLNLATAASVDLHLITTNTGTISINASTASGATTLKGAGAGITNIIGGAGADAITANGAGSIVGGAGADTLSVATTGALSVSDSDGITITVSGSTASNITTTSALTETTITGDTGVDTITLAGSVSNVATITGGQGADVIDLGANHTGGVKWILTAESTAPTSANTVDAVISNYVKSLDKISASALILGVQTATAGVGVATISAGGVATFNAVDTTLAQHFAAVAAALQATAGATAIWTEGSDSYVYVSDGILANAATDYTVKLVGVTAGALTISSNAITAIA